MEYHVTITSLMQKVIEVLIDRFVGMDHCIINKGRNLVVEVPRREVANVVLELKKHFPDVVDIRKAYQMIDDLHDFILVKPIVSEAPLYAEGSISVPTLEKSLVDIVADKEYAGETKSEMLKTYQQSFERYPVNVSKLLRYAARKGKKEEVMELCEQMDRQRIEIVKNICEVLDNAPIVRAWIFGSFARQEERPDSDIDILVDMDPARPIGLLAYTDVIESLENATGRKVDLVANGSLKPYARESVERDKVLVYERTR